MTYTYDEAGRQTYKTGSRGTTSYEYDAAGRLSRVVMPSDTAEYTYDNVGNRQTMLETYSEAKTLTQGDASVTYVKKEVTYAYDANNCNDTIHG